MLRLVKKEKKKKKKKKKELIKTVTVAKTLVQEKPKPKIMPVPLTEVPFPGGQELVQPKKNAIPIEKKRAELINTHCKLISNLWLARLSLKHVLTEIAMYRNDRRSKPINTEKLQRLMLRLEYLEVRHRRKLKKAKDIKIEDKVVCNESKEEGSKKERIKEAVKEVKKTKRRLLKR